MTDSKIKIAWEQWIQDEFINNLESKFNKILFNWPSGYELWCFSEKCRKEALVHWDFIDNYVDIDIDRIVNIITLQDVREMIC